jgi:hypothetical protein
MPALDLLSPTVARLYIPGIGMISTTSIHAPRHLQVWVVFAKQLSGRAVRLSLHDTRERRSSCLMPRCRQHAWFY